MATVILLSQFPLPYSHIGSWTTMYRNYLQSSHAIDAIVCAQPKQYFDNVHYQVVADNFWIQLRKKVSKNNHLAYIDALGKLIKPDQKYILQVVDNFGLVKALHKYIERNNLKEHCYLQFFYHGHAPFAGYTAKFYERTDEIIVLTNSAYEAFRSQTNILPSRFSVLYNGIDTQKFHAISTAEKENLKTKHGFSGKKLFMWCSQDRPKKGLHLILDAWKTIHKNHPDAALLVIGCEPKSPQPGVFYGGRIQNDLLPQYYQMSDVFLFSTLCQEGFGLSLIEAMHCGCYCIASAMGGVPEVMQNGALGKLIARPHFTDEWIEAVDEYLTGNATIPTIPKDLYTAQQWNDGMDAIIRRAKNNIG